MDSELGYIVLQVAVGQAFSSYVGGGKRGTIPRYNFSLRESRDI